MQANKLDRQGYLWGIVSYVMWGFFPLYWKLLHSRANLEVLAHRMIWSFVFYAFIFVVFSRRNWRQLARQSIRDWALIALATAALTLNWGIYIYAVNSGHILEGSLAYFINPILNVAVGVFFFREPFPLVLKLSVGFAAFGVALKIGFSSAFPWISLSLAFLFCFYGMIKKILKMPVMTSSFLEGGLGVLPAIFYLSLVPPPPADLATWLLFAGAGLVTGLPLFLFSFSAQRVPYSVMGMMQFIAPSLQFLVAVLVYGEPFDHINLAAFACIWIAIAFYLAYPFLKQNARLA